MILIEIKLKLKVKFYKIKFLEFYAKFIYIIQHSDNLFLSKIL